jgi:hypothetical protein
LAFARRWNLAAFTYVLGLLNAWFENIRSRRQGSRRCWALELV